MLIEKLLNVKATILVLGETGCGKSFWAEELAKKKGKRVVRVDLAALNEQTMLSELFGHEKGAFTGAIQQKKGLCSLVGPEEVLVLDEIGELGLEAQKKLLTFLQTYRFRAVGGTKEEVFRGSLIAITNRDLAKMVEQGEFRQDLYYRLKIFTHRLPTLRSYTRKEREDLISHLWRKLHKKYGPIASPNLDQSVLDFFHRYSWPGNIRELEHILEYILVIHSGEQVCFSTIEHLFTPVVEGDSLNSFFQIGQRSFREVKELFEKQYLDSLLREAKGNVKRAASIASMQQSSLRLKIRQYAINVLDYKDTLHLAKVA